MSDDDVLERELTLMDSRITCLSDITLSTALRSLNLHGNHISKIEGLDHLCNLVHLDLSSNRIRKIEGLDCLLHLKYLSLSCNKLTKIEGLDKLVNLRKLNLTYNSISDLSGLIPLHGMNHKLSHLYLHGNAMDNLDHVLRGMKGLHCLIHLTFQLDERDNPVCFEEGYRDVVLKNLPQLQALDGVSRSGESVPGYFVDYLDYLGLDHMESFSNLELSDPESNKITALTSTSLPTPRIDQVLSQYRKPPIAPETTENLSSYLENTATLAVESVTNQYLTTMLHEIRFQKLEDQMSQILKDQQPKPETIMKPTRDTDPTTESDQESGKENVVKSVTKSSRIPARSNSQTQKQKGPPQLRATKQTAARRRKSPSHQRGDRSPSSGPSSRSNTDHAEQVSKRPIGLSRSLRGLEPSVSNLAEVSTYKALVQNLDQERERRWKAEQLVVKLTQNIKELQNQSKEEKDINSMAVHATDRIKELLVKERNEKCTLQALVHKLKEENEKLADKIEQSASKEKDYQQELRRMEEAMSKHETQRMQQKALEMKHIQGAELKLTASLREMELLRGSVRQHKDKVKQLHDLLTSREQEHRKELESRVQLNGPEFREAVAKELSREEDRHKHQIKELHEKINILTQQYTDLEDEFRAALVIEAGRFKEVKEGFDRVTEELAEFKEALSHSQLKEKKSANLVQELTTMVKEQKKRIADITTKKQEIIQDLKSRIRSLEMVAAEEKQKNLQIQLLKQEKSKLITHLTAQESLIDGLKAERKIWEQELSHQGVSLAQDRGRLEAKIEVLSTEIEGLKKQNERDNDALKIKTKMVEDQTETIRKLKEGLQERDERIRKLHTQNLEMEKALSEKNDEKAIKLHELKEKLERQIERKEEIKLQLEEKEAELEDVKKAYSAMNKKWQDKAELLSQLETQVRQMKENFDAKEKQLIQERDKSLQKQKVVMEKLHSLDDAFRRQLESALAAHQAELTKVVYEKQKEIEAANDRVHKVEEEMRQLLQETAHSKKAMEEKIKRFSSALSDIQQHF